MMNSNHIPVKRALLSVADKSNIVEFARKLQDLNIEILATGGTSDALQKANITHTPIETLTGFANLFEGRLKTLHPKIQGGILGKRDKHQVEADSHDIQWIDLVVVNFYPFEVARLNNLDAEQMIEYIDIGGPTMVRSAAKNHAWVGVVVDPIDYDVVIDHLAQQKSLPQTFRSYLAKKAFALTSKYDANIHDYFMQQENLPDVLQLNLIKKQDLRYGENPHQKACVYQFPNHPGVLSAHIHQGKTLSFNNLLDAEAAYNCINEFDEPTAVIIKHANPCGVASGFAIENAFEQAFAADALSAFGGIIAINRPCSRELACLILENFVEVIIAPHFTQEALALLSSKPNIRLLELPKLSPPTSEMKFLSDGILWQEKDNSQLDKHLLDCVTQAKPSAHQIEDMLFAWRVLKHVKSNAIVIAASHQTLGIGAGQVSRIDAVDLALKKADDLDDQAVLASDAFFPFRDSIDRISISGVKAIIQPGGARRDAEVISACDQYGIAMIFTHQRCFKH